MVFEEMSLAALKQYAKEEGIKGISALKKSDLIERLKAEAEKKEGKKEEKKEEKRREKRREERNQAGT